jgi:hypothetical protein
MRWDPKHVFILCTPVHMVANSTVISSSASLQIPLQKTAPDERTASIGNILRV